MKKENQELIVRIGFVIGLIGFFTAGCGAVTFSKIIVTAGLKLAVIGIVVWSGACISPIKKK